MLSTESLIAFSTQSTHHAVIDGNSSRVWENAGVLEANWTSVQSVGIMQMWKK